MNTRCANAIGTLGVVLAISGHAIAQSRVESNVVYGMYSGTSLLLDVHHPARPNGIGVIFIAGSGWNARLGYASSPLKESEQVGMYVPSLTAAGYTVFAVTHRATPTFRYPAPVEDVQRAVRFVRANAAKYNIDSTRIGGVGGSSGAHLLSLMGTLDGVGDNNDPDPVNRQSAKLQAIAARAAPLDLTEMRPSDVADALAMFIGARVSETTPKTSVEYKTAWAASPLAHVSADDAPFLLLHGDADESVPFRQSERMEAALKGAGVPVKLVRIAGAGHGPDFPGAKTPPDYKGEIVRFLDAQLRRAGPVQGSR